MLKNSRIDVFNLKRLLHLADFRDIFGVSKGAKMEGEDGEEWRKLPCEDRIAHKVICFGFSLDLRKRRI